MIDHDVFLEKLNELLKRFPCKREIKKIEKLLQERFPEERLDSPIVRFTGNCLYFEDRHIEPESLKNGYISLFNKTSKMPLTEERFVLKFCGSLLNNKQTILFEDRELLLVDKWFYDTNALNISIDQQRDMSVVSIMQLKRTQKMRTSPYWHNYYIPKNWNKKDVLAHLLTAGRLPVLKEARKYSLLNER